MSYEPHVNELSKKLPKPLGLLKHTSLFLNYKKVARIILHADREVFSIILFNTLNWLPFYKESLLKRSALVYKRVNDCNVPRYIRETLVKNCDVHSRGTRYNNFNLYLFGFVETPRKFIIAELSIRKLGSSSVLIILLLLALMKIRAYGSKALQ